MGQGRKAARVFVKLPWMSAACLPSSCGITPCLCVSAFNENNMPELKMSHAPSQHFLAIIVGLFTTKEPAWCFFKKCEGACCVHPTGGGPCSKRSNVVGAASSENPPGKWRQSKQSLTVRPGEPWSRVHMRPLSYQHLQKCVSTHNGPPATCREPGDRSESLEAAFDPVPYLCASEFQDTFQK